MNIYEKEVYNFLTQKENYKSSKELVTQLSQVEDLLRIEFWQEVKKNINIYIDINSLASDWEAGFAYPGWLGVHYKKHPKLAIACDNR